VRLTPASPTIRPETPADHAAVRAVHLAAFPTPAEADLVDRLRAEGDATLSLVSETWGTITGHVLLSPLKAPVRALALAPVATLPSHQRQGQGSALIQAAITAAREAAWDAILVLGEPAYYTRFGFSAEAARGYECAYAGPYLMLLPLTARPFPKGPITYARAFELA
jgi:putative acetyltransferase